MNAAWPNENTPETPTNVYRPTTIVKLMTLPSTTRSSESGPSANVASETTQVSAISTSSGQSPSVSSSARGRRPRSGA